ncbi:hypothetical protein QR680_000958 [Steinernema hermaphroditum]|uniref:Uncharacterized protein n=1 Tax=Steinernema hermaphroditum TaxID=289476 RepID=A0AA39GWH3_9BILA|nr:hypothetical protein QR680_000958 [Steinernema hermaphroditum]
MQIKSILDVPPEELRWVYYAPATVVLPDGTSKEVLQRCLCTGAMREEILRAAEARRQEQALLEEEARAEEEEPAEGA